MKLTYICSDLADGFFIAHAAKVVFAFYFSDLKLSYISTVLLLDARTLCILKHFSSVILQDCRLFKKRTPTSRMERGRGRKK